MKNKSAKDKILESIRVKKSQKQLKSIKSNSKSDSKSGLKSESKSDSSQSQSQGSSQTPNKSKNADNYKYVKASKDKKLAKGKKPLAKSTADVSKREHTFRIKRLKKKGCHKLIDDLEASCNDFDEFKWELYKQEWFLENQSPHKSAKIHDPFEGTMRNRLEEHEWKGRKFLIPENSSFKPEYIDKLINHLRLGGSLKSFSADIYVHEQTVLKWLREIEVFQLAANIGVNGHLGVLEKVLHFTSVGMDINKLSKEFDAKRINHETLRHLSKSKYRDEFYEKVKIENGGEDRPISEIDGAELREEVEKLDAQEAKLQSENPFKEFNPIRGKD